MTTLTDIRARVRTDLHDEDAGEYRWVSAELDRHIFNALRELSLAVPLESRAVLKTAAGARELSLSSLAGLALVDSVEYPAGLFPPSFVDFHVWGDTLTLLTDRTPGEGEEAAVYYGRLHTLDYSGSTVPEALEDVLVAGASGYAALSMSGFTINRLNTGGEAVWQSYMVWGRERLNVFHRALARHGRNGRLRSRQLRRPAAAVGSR